MSVENLSRDQKNKAWEDLLMYYGLPPHDVGYNIVEGDGHFAASLARRYGMNIEQLSKGLGFDEKVLYWRESRKKIDVILVSPYAGPV